MSRLKQLEERMLHYAKVADTLTNERDALCAQRDELAAKLDNLCNAIEAGAPVDPRGFIKDARSTLAKLDGGK